MKRKYRGILIFVLSFAAIVGYASAGGGSEELFLVVQGVHKLDQRLRRAFGQLERQPLAARDADLPRHQVGAGHLRVRRQPCQQGGGPAVSTARIQDAAMATLAGAPAAEHDHMVLQPLHLPGLVKSMPCPLHDLYVFIFTFNRPI